MNGPGVFTWADGLRYEVRYNNDIVAVIKLKCVIIAHLFFL